MLYCKDGSCVFEGDSFIYKTSLYYNDLRYYMLLGTKLYEAQEEIPINRVLKQGNFIIECDLYQAPLKYLKDENYIKIDEKQNKW